MLLEVGEFCRRVAAGLHGLVAELQEQTGPYGQAGQLAWEISLEHAARVLNRPELERLHLHLGDRGSVLLEYRLPASAAWADLVLLGRGESPPSGVVVEFKDWDTFGDRPGPFEGLVWHHERLELQPAEQVRGYTEYCRRFHSAVQDAGADVEDCVYFSRPGAPLSTASLRTTCCLPPIGLRRDILDEADRPCSGSGCRVSWQGLSWHAPRLPNLRPSKDFLAERFELYQKAG